MPLEEDTGVEKTVAREASWNRNGMLLKLKSCYGFLVCFGFYETNCFTFDTFCNEVDDEGE